MCYGFQKAVQANDKRAKESGLTEEEYIYELMKQSLAVLNMTVSDFFDLEPYIISDLLGTAKERDEYNHRLMYIAVTNAIGGMFSNKYKYLDVFDDKNIPKEYSEEEANDLRNELLNAFK